MTGFVRSLLTMRIDLVWSAFVLCNEGGVWVEKRLEEVEKGVDKEDGRARHLGP